MTVVHAGRYVVTGGDSCISAYDTKTETMAVIHLDPADRSIFQIAARSKWAFAGSISGIWLTDLENSYQTRYWKAPLPVGAICMTDRSCWASAGATIYRAPLEKLGVDGKPSK
jgi:hypothetical protein